MEFNIRIKLDAPRGGLRRLTWFVGLPVAMVAAAGAVAYAYDTTWIATGEKLSASQLKGNLDEIQTRLAALEDAKTALDKRAAALEALASDLEQTDCPTGYTKGTATGITVCTKGADEVVKVGTGGSSFWVDRYEASIWDTFDANGTQYGATSPAGALVTDYPSTFPKNGQRTVSFVPLYAVSKVGVQPSASMTWFQALEACAASGKRLPTGDEWQRAATGTNDPGANNGTAGACVTSGVQGPRASGGGTACLSVWGAENMIGNVWEWIADWYATAGNPGVGINYVNMPVQSWPPGADYGNDNTWNVQTWVKNGGADVTGLPSAGTRGGPWVDGEGAGVFELGLYNAPSNWYIQLGVRCMIPR